MRIALDGHEVLDLHAARQRDAAEVVPGQVHQHQMFGALLFVAQQLVGERDVFGSRFAARPGSGDRAQDRRAVIQLAERLGRRTDQDARADLQEEGVG